jgi:putative transposase
VSCCDSRCRRRSLHPFGTAPQHDQFAGTPHQFSVSTVRDCFQLRFLGSYFFTVNLLERWPNDLLTRHIDLLRQAVRSVCAQYPVRIDAWVVLPDHMHCVWTLPSGDADFTLRWRLIKAAFSKQLPKVERRSKVRAARGERAIWQRRFWEHTLRDERDYAAHVDYVHFNPVKHGHARAVKEWPYSTFHRDVAQGVYLEDWGGSDADSIGAAGERR